MTNMKILVGRDEVTQLTLQLRKKLIFSIIQKSKVF